MSGQTTGLVGGVDVGGTNMQFGVVDANNTIVGRAGGKTEAAGGLDHVVSNVVKGVRGACERTGISVDDLDAIGVVAAGSIDIPGGVILSAPNLQWVDVPLREILENELGAPIMIDNDVNGAVWGEFKLGAGRGSDDLLGVWIGTGVGGALVLGGELYHGGFFAAGEIGGTVITPDGLPGERTVEDHCSRTGMVRTLRRMMSKYSDSLLHRLRAKAEGQIGTEALAEAYRQGDELTARVINNAAGLLGIAIANCVSILSVKTVLLGGGITEALGKPYLDRVAESFRGNISVELCRNCALKMTELAADSGLLGAALLARGATNGQ